ncbi:MAG: hypothetical protein AAGH41_11695 [Pseudomonadota bacterium]
MLTTEFDAVLGALDGRTEETTLPAASTAAGGLTPLRSPSVVGTASLLVAGPAPWPKRLDY